MIIRIKVIIYFENKNKVYFYFSEINNKFLLFIFLPNHFSDQGNLLMMLTTCEINLIMKRLFKMILDLLNFDYFI